MQTTVHAAISSHADSNYIYDADSFYNFFIQSCKFKYEKSGVYTRYYVEPRWGDGYMEQIRLENGLELCITNLQLKRSISLKYHLEKPPLEMHYMSEGNVVHHEKAAGDMNLGSGKLSVFFRMDMEGVMTFVEGRKIVFVTIIVPDQTLEKYLNVCRYTGIIQEYRNSNMMFDIMKPHTPTAELKAIFGQILSCPFTDVGKSLFFQGKAAELVAYIWEQSALYTKSSDVIILHPYENTALEKAKEIIENNLSHNFSIEEIANMVGLNIQKFKKGFKQLYRLTPHQYLIRCRMLRARELMRDSGYSVSETAFAVGYTNVSYFSKTFREHYGQTPKHFRFGL